MKRAIWSAPALADLDDLDTYFRDRSPDYARHVGRTAIAAARFLASHPDAGPSFSPVLRKWTVKGTDYVLLYRPVASGIEVIRVMHAKRDWRPR